MKGPGLKAQGIIKAVTVTGSHMRKGCEHFYLCAQMCASDTAASVILVMGL